MNRVLFSDPDASIFHERISLGLHSYAIRGDVPGLIAKLDTFVPSGVGGFWSGNRTAAMEWADSKGRMLLETTPGGRLVNDWRFLNSAWKDWPGLGEDFWGGLSAKYASGVSGPTFSLQTPERAAPDGVNYTFEGGYTWRNYELPEVNKSLANGKIPYIEYHLLPSSTGLTLGH